MELLCLIAFGVVFFGASKEAGIDADVFKFDDIPSYEEWKGTYSPEEINTRIQIYDIGRRLGRGIAYQERAFMATKNEAQTSFILEKLPPLIR